jgi:hypothetical protein
MKPSNEMLGTLQLLELSVDELISRTGLEEMILQFLLDLLELQLG